jgi:hypothetical protein
MRNSLTLIDSDRVKSKINLFVIADFLERSVEFEKATKEANRLINHDRYLDNEYEISQAELFIELLRRHGGGS